MRPMNCPKCQKDVSPKDSPDPRVLILDCESCGHLNYATRKDSQGLDLTPSRPEPSITYDEPELTDDDLAEEIGEPVSVTRLG